LRVDNIDVQRHLDPALPPLRADPHQLHQVVVNLVTNAYQAVRQTGGPHRLTIMTRPDPAQSRVVLEVADTGPGMTPEVLARIFEPFFTTKPSGEGTGLGLPLCQGIIESHGGIITVESQPGHGTVFRVTLPTEPAPVSASPASETEALPPIDGQGKAILVVDDEDGIAKALAYLLRRDGHHVDTAANGRLALAKLQKQAYDLIVCDLRMPELDGPGLYQEVAAWTPHLLARFIFLTGDMMSPETETFLKRAKVPRLNKPFRAMEVRRVVRQALRALPEQPEQ
jgi:CheY-like chemotaxis protein